MRAFFLWYHLAASTNLVRTTERHKYQRLPLESREKPGHKGRTSLIVRLAPML